MLKYFFFFFQGMIISEMWEDVTGKLLPEGVYAGGLQGMI